MFTRTGILYFYHRLRVQSSPFAQIPATDTEVLYLYKMSGRTMNLQGSDRHTSQPNYLWLKESYSDDWRNLRSFNLSSLFLFSFFRYFLALQSAELPVKEGSIASLTPRTLRGFNRRHVLQFHRDWKIMGNAFMHCKQLVVIRSSFLWSNS